MRRILPAGGGPLTALDALMDVPRAIGRPAVRCVMVQSVDGAIAVDGRSGGLGGDADRRVFLANRSLADIVLVGAGTVRAEGYGPAKLTPELVAARVARGQAPLPRIAVVSGRLDLDWSSPFFTEATAKPIVVTSGTSTAAARTEAAEVADIVVAGDAHVDHAAALAEFGRLGAALVICEGGPTLNGSLLSAGLIDELCLTLSPIVVGGDGPRIIAGPASPIPTPMRHHAIFEDDGFVFLLTRPERAPK